MFCYLLDRHVDYACMRISIGEGQAYIFLEGTLSLR